MIALFESMFESVKSEISQVFHDLCHDAIGCLLFLNY